MRVQRNPELAWREVGGETIVIHLGRKMMYGLNPAAGRIWAALEGGATLEELESAPAEVGTEEATRAAVRAFLADLAVEELIVPEAPLPAEAATTGSGSSAPYLPRIVWREEVRRFAGACAKFPGVSVICSQQPNRS